MSVAVEEHIACSKFCESWRNVNEAEAHAVALQSDLHRPCLKKIVVPSHDKDWRPNPFDCLQGRGAADITEMPDLIGGGDVTRHGFRESIMGVGDDRDPEG